MKHKVESGESIWSKALVLNAADPGSIASTKYKTYALGRVIPEHWAFRSKPYTWTYLGITQKQKQTLT